jgi:hypothetical protein
MIVSDGYYRLHFLYTTNWQGYSLGDELGPALGVALRKPDGNTLGKALGPALGDNQSDPLGSEDGNSLGEELVPALGGTLGEPVGSDEGNARLAGGVLLRGTLGPAIVPCTIRESTRRSMDRRPAETATASTISDLALKPSISMVRTRFVCNSVATKANIRQRH